MPKTEKLFSVLAVITMLLCAVLPAFCAVADSTVGVFTYEIIKDEAAITGCRSDVEGDVIIPMLIDNYPVTSIKGYSFQECGGIIFVRIPSTVVTIGDGAFQGCRSLKTVNIPDSVKTIGDYAFYNCVLLSDVEMGSSVEKIGEGAFGRCAALQRIDLPSSVIEIGKNAFLGCTDITLGVNSNDYSFEYVKANSFKYVFLDRMDNSEGSSEGYVSQSEIYTGEDISGVKTTGGILNGGSGTGRTLEQKIRFIAIVVPASAVLLIGVIMFLKINYSSRKR